MFTYCLVGPTTFHENSLAESKHNKSCYAYIEKKRGMKQTGNTYRTLPMLLKKERKNHLTLRISA